jgi:hypothetical protein
MSESTNTNAATTVQRYAAMPDGGYNRASVAALTAAMTGRVSGGPRVPWESIEPSTGRAPRVSPRME